MIRLLAIALILALSGVPLIVVPSLPLMWLTLPGVALGLAGVIVSSVPLVTVSAALALIEYTFALTITGAAVDVVTATGFGAALFLLLELVHFGGRVHGAALSPAVVITQLRHWLGLVTLAAASAAVFTFAGAALRLVMPGGMLPLVVILSAVGALAALAGVVALTARD